MMRVKEHTMFSKVMVRSVGTGLYSLGVWLAAFGVGRAVDEPQEPAEPAAVVSDQMKSVLKGGPRKRKAILTPEPEKSSDQDSAKDEGPLVPIEAGDSKNAAEKSTDGKDTAQQKRSTDSSISRVEDKPKFAAKQKSESGNGRSPDPGQSQASTKTPGASSAPSDSEKISADSVKNRFSGNQNVRDLIKAVRPQPAKIEGIQVNKSTVEDLRRVWGEPRATEDIEDGGTTLIFDRALLGTVHATVEDSQVLQLMVQLDQALTPRVACERLSIRLALGVDVSDEKGNLLGRAFPEQGVLLSYQGGQRLPVVQHIILEPISAEAFVTRVEGDLHGRYLANLADLKFAQQSDPEYARAYWLSARVHLATGQFETASEAAIRAAQLAPEEGMFQVTRARCLAAGGKHKLAIREVEKLLRSRELEPVVRAAALSLQGELVAARDGTSTAKAMRYHTQAIKIADPLAVSEDPQLRRQAKEILLDTHLAVARDIAWGNWKKKENVVPRWLERSSAFAEESIDNEAGSLELRLRVAEKALLAYSRMTPAMDPSSWIQEAEETVERLLDESDDPLFVSRVEWRLGMANYHALTLARARGKSTEALKYAKASIRYLDSGARLRQSTLEDNHLVGRLFYQTGAVHAVLLNDHREAVKWYDQAMPRLNRGLRSSLLADMRGHGDALVSMGVTYWESGDRKRAVQMTTAGSKVLQRAVDDRLLSENALAVAYGNLSLMHKQLGDTQQAQRYAERLSGGNRRR